MLEKEEDYIKTPMQSDDDEYFDSYYSDDDDIVCRCNICNRARSGGKEAPPPQKNIQMYHRHRQTMADEPSRQKRFVVMTYHGFSVSFPDPDPDPNYNLREKQPQSEEDAEKTFANKRQQLIAQGLWGDERARYYTNLIDDLEYQHADCSRVAFPRHHALVATAFASSVSILESAHLWDAPIARMRVYAPYWDIMKTNSKRAAMAPASSVFTESTGRQRIKLVGYSGMSGILCARLFGSFHRAYQRFAFEIMRRAHSSHTSEMLVDNHYRAIPPPNDHTFDMMPLKTARAELRILYPECIDDLRTKARQYRCGRIDICEIHLDERFKKMHSLMILCTKRLMTPNILIDPIDPKKPNPKPGTGKYITRIMKFVTEFSGLYDKDVVRMYGLSMIKLRAATITSQIRLAKQGCYAALLAFAELEPGMVDDHLAPEVGSRYGGINTPECQNVHIPSRHAIFGKLLQMHRHHIPRTADVLKDVCRYTL